MEDFLRELKHACPGGLLTNEIFLDICRRHGYAPIGTAEMTSYDGAYYYMGFLSCHPDGEAHEGLHDIFRRRVEEGYDIRHIRYGRAPDGIYLMLGQERGDGRTPVLAMGTMDGKYIIGVFPDIEDQDISVASKLAQEAGVQLPNSPTPQNPFATYLDELDLTGI